APLLKRIAEETGGRFFTPTNVASLPEAISYSGRGVTVVEERELWDMPALFMLLITLVSAERSYRRIPGLARLDETHCNTQHRTMYFVDMKVGLPQERFVRFVFSRVSWRRSAR